MKKEILFLVLTVIFILPSNGQVDSVDIGYSIHGKHPGDIILFNNNDLLDISLSFDVSYMKKNKPDSAYLNAVLTYYTKETDSVKKDIKIRARGNFRRKYCDFPPLNLNFKTDDTTGGEFRGLDRLKLVTYCKRGYQQYVLKEYLVYKLYNIMTDNSLRVRLLRMNFIDNNSKPDKPLTEFGFVIEPVYSFEERTGLNEIDNIFLTQKNIKPEFINRIALFNYLIGNSDWSVPIRHNIISFAQPGSGVPEQAIAVPYDFDYSELVNAEYAAPASDSGIDEEYKRRYLGMCRPEEELLKTIGEFREKKDDLFKEINEFPYLRKSVKKEMINFLGSFYSKIDNKNSLLNEIMQQCLNF